MESDRGSPSMTDKPFLLKMVPLSEFGGASAGSCGNSLPRRLFIKRTGGATVAVMVSGSLLEKAKAGPEDGGGGGSLSSRIETRHRMKCVYEPEHTDGSITWLEKTTYSGAGSEKWTTLKTTGPSKNTVATSQMTKVEGHVLSSILSSGSGSSDPFWARTVLKMPDGPYYGGQWLKEDEDAPNFEQEKSDPGEPLNDPKVNLEIKAFSAAMTFSHSGYFIDLVSVTQTGGAALNKTFKTTNGTEQSNQAGAEGQLGTAPPGELEGSLTKDGISAKIKGGILPFTMDGKYQAGGESNRTEEFEKVTDNNNTSTWQTTENLSSSCSGNVFAGWCIYHETQKKRVNLQDGQIVSEQIIQDWTMVDQLGTIPEE
jgi:hypothetical protein